MFEKDQQTVTGPGTVIGSNVKLTGTLKDVNDITVHGHVDGEVISDKNVDISETASIKGPVSAHIVTISGKVNGSVSASEKLVINPTGKIYGSINTKDLIIQSGAIFVGKSTTSKEDADASDIKSVKTDKKDNKKTEPKLDDKKNEPKYEVE